MDSILFILFTLIGLAGILLAVGFLLAYLFKSSKLFLSIGLGSLAVSLFSFGLIYWYYRILIPSTNEDTKKEFSGTYKLEEIKSAGRRKELVCS